MSRVELCNGILGTVFAYIEDYQISKFYLYNFFTASVYPATILIFLIYYLGLAQIHLKFKIADIECELELGTRELLLGFQPARAARKLEAYKNQTRTS